MKRKLVVFAVAVILSVGVYAKGGDEAAGQGTGGKAGGANISIRFISRYGDRSAVDAAGFLDGLEEFRKNNPTVTVVDESITDEAQYNNKFKILVATNDLPTVFMTYGGGTAKNYVENGLVSDLTADLNADKAWYDGFVPSMFDMITFNRGIYGIPYAAYVGMMYCNMDQFKKIGMEPPKTIDEFEKVCDAFIKQGIAPMPVGDKSNFRGGHLLATLMVRRSGTELALQLANRQKKYNDPVVVEILTKMKSWADKGYLGKNITTLDSEGERSGFLNGESPMIFHNAYFIGRIVNDSKNPNQVKVVHFPYFSGYPEFKDGWHGGSSDVFSISSAATAEQKKAGLALLKTCTAMKYMIQRNEASAGGFVSVLKNTPPMANQPQMTTDFLSAFANMKYLLTEPGEYDPNPGLREATRTAIQAMWAGNSVANTVQTIQTVIDTE
jgi:ABC-type glycerol-3-phosphate transport system substrate-binding protein